MSIVENYRDVEIYKNITGASLELHQLLQAAYVGFWDDTKTNPTEMPKITKISIPPEMYFFTEIPSGAKIVQIDSTLPEIKRAIDKMLDGFTTTFFAEANADGRSVSEITLGSEYQAALEKYRNLPIGTSVNRVWMKRDYINNRWAAHDITYFVRTGKDLPSDIDATLLYFANNS